MDFSVISRAGLTQVEFAQLAGVSRVTTNMWVRGKMLPHRYIRAKVAALLKVLDSAVANATLPLEDAVAKEDRMRFIKIRLRVEKTRLESAAG